jgi:hypothetical protein
MDSMLNRKGFKTSDGDPTIRVELVAEDGNLGALVDVFDEVLDKFSEGYEVSSFKVYDDPEEVKAVLELCKADEELELDGVTVSEVEGVGIAVGAYVFSEESAKQLADFINGVDKHSGYAGVFFSKTDLKAELEELEALEELRSPKGSTDTFVAPGVDSEGRAYTGLSFAARDLYQTDCKAGPAQKEYASARRTRDNNFIVPSVDSEGREIQQ